MGVKNKWNVSFIATTLIYCRFHIISRSEYSYSTEIKLLLSQCWWIRTGQISSSSSRDKKKERWGRYETSAQIRSFSSAVDSRFLLPPSLHSADAWWRDKQKVSSSGCSVSLLMSYHLFRSPKCEFKVHRSFGSRLAGYGYMWVKCVTWSGTEWCCVRIVCENCECRKSNKMPFGGRSPLETLALPGVILAYKYRQFRQRRCEAANRRVTERELSALHYKIVSHGLNEWMNDEGKC